MSQLLRQCFFPCKRWVISIIMQLTLTVPRFCVCKFADSLKLFFGNSKPILMVWSFTNTGRAAKNLSRSMCLFPAEVDRRSSGFLFLLHPVNKYLFCALLSATSLASVCFSVVMSQFEVAPDGSAEVQAVVPEFVAAAMCILEKLRVLDKRLAMSSTLPNQQHSQWGLSKQKQSQVLITWEKCCNQRLTGT